METANPKPKEMNNDNETMTKTATVLSALGNKRDVAMMIKVSVRSVDNYIAAGCPVIKLSPRCCRFDLAEVKEWFKNQYGQQQRKNFV